MPRLLFVGLLAACSLMAKPARASDAAPATLDMRQAISELALASKAADEALVPAELVDNIPKWEILLDVSARLKDSVSAAVQNTDAAISSLKITAEKYQGDQAKMDVIRGRIDALQSQSDQFMLFEGELEKETVKLAALLDQIKNDPEVKAVLEAEALSGKVDAAIQRSEDAVPAFLREQ